jgi:hypothetical protein
MHLKPAILNNLAIVFSIIMVFQLGAGFTEIEA